jgi:DNA-binding response OmpR family regulator
MAARENPDLIMVDMNLPDMSGEAVVSRLRGDRSSVSSIPIIAVTASTDSDLRARVVAAGCDDYVQKPFTTTELLAAVTSHFAAAEKV